MTHDTVAAWRRALAANGRAWLGALALMAGLASGPASADEAAVRSATQALVEAWNRHDAKAVTELLAEDVWYTETNDSLYQRQKGRERAMSLLAYSIENSDLQWDIVRVKPLRSHLQFVLSLKAGAGLHLVGAARVTGFVRLVATADMHADQTVFLSTESGEPLQGENGELLER